MFYKGWSAVVVNILTSVLSHILYYTLTTPYFFLKDLPIAVTPVTLVTKNDLSRAILKGSERPTLEKDRK